MQQQLLNLLTMSVCGGKCESLLTVKMFHLPDVITFQLVL